MQLKVDTEQMPTLVNLLMRFFEINSGRIKIDGVPTSEMTRESVHDLFSMVLQDTWLKTGTLRDNIMMGRPDATEEEMIAAAKASHVHSFIRRLPKDTTHGLQRTEEDFPRDRSSSCVLQELC